jgi:hypothetical protein
VPLKLIATSRHRPALAPDGRPYCPDCYETGWRWRVISGWSAWVGQCHCGRVVDPPPGGWSLAPEPPPDPGSLLDPRPAAPGPGNPHPVTVRHPFRRDERGRRAFDGYEPYYPVCGGCGWVARPQRQERRAWDLAWAHAGLDWRAVPVQPDPRARRRQRRRGRPPAPLPASYRGPVPCHFGLADRLGCGKGHLADQRDGVTTKHPCGGVIPPRLWRGTTDRPDQDLEALAAACGEVCVCPCHLAADHDALPRRCRCGLLLPADWPAYRPCDACEARSVR